MKTWMYLNCFLGCGNGSFERERIIVAADISNFDLSASSGVVYGPSERRCEGFERWHGMQESTKRWASVASDDHQ